MWYKFHAIHGPGHQSRVEEYVWLTGKWSKKALQNHWDHWTRDFDWPVGGFERVEELPEEVMNVQVDKYTGLLIHASEMLRVLGVNDQMIVHCVMGKAGNV
jgi:hypothetical protein